MLIYVKCTKCTYIMYAMYEKYEIDALNAVNAITGDFKFLCYYFLVLEHSLVLIGFAWLSICAKGR